MTCFWLGVTVNKSDNTSMSDVRSNHGLISQDAKGQKRITIVDSYNS